MNKAELIKAVAEKTKLSQADAQKALDVFFDTVKDSLKSGEPVQLVGFGSFKVTERKERKGINPQTKEEITIKATKVPKFVPGKEFKELVKKA
ncbi:HU family DNA-binding protein [bacterium]|nr:HU family DNA-binding protein [bacterium]